jgi:hypothetical protein
MLFSFVKDTANEPQTNSLGHLYSSWQVLIFPKGPKEPGDHLPPGQQLVVRPGPFRALEPVWSKSQSLGLKTD